MQLSIIIPTYNTTAYLKDAIQSCLDQPIPSLEIIVVDDGSTDDVAAAVARFPQVLLLRQPHNSGLSAARNRGASAARGEYLLFLDADDVLGSDVTRFFAQGDGDVRLVGWTMTDLIGQQLADHPPPRLLPDPFHALLPFNRFPVHAAVIRRRCWSAVGGFNEGMAAHEDWDFWLRVALTGATFSTATGGRVLWRRREGSLSGDAAAMLRNALAVLAWASKQHPVCAICADKLTYAPALHRRHWASALRLQLYQSLRRLLLLARADPLSVLYLFRPRQRP